MRVIAGKYRHRIINMTNLETTRETQDKVRGAIFNSIGPNIYNKTFLDLFSGSGAMGIEAISRGGCFSLFNDINKEAIKVINANIDSLKIERKCYEVFNLDYQKLLNTLVKPFDYIYVDPPYDTVDTYKLLNAITNSKVCNNETIIIIEMKSSTTIDLIDNATILKEKKYGSKKVAFFSILA